MKMRLLSLLDTRHDRDAYHDQFEYNGQFYEVELKFTTKEVMTDYQATVGSHGVHGHDVYSTVSDELYGWNVRRLDQDGNGTPVTGEEAEQIARAYFDTLINP